MRSESCGRSHVVGVVESERWSRSGGVRVVESGGFKVKSDSKVSLEMELKSNLLTCDS